MELKMLFLWGICQNIIMFICGDSKMRRKGRKRWRGKKRGGKGKGGRERGRKERERPYSHW